MSRGFKEVPVLDWKLIETGQKPKFIAQLRDALVNVGFLYLQNPPVQPEVVKKVIDICPKLFDLSDVKKQSLDMTNSPHFLGYSSFGSELTKGAVDQREQFDFGTPYECKWKPGDPDYLKLWGPPQWPNEEDLSGFRETFVSYLSQVESLSEVFTEYVSEALGLDTHALDVFFDNPKSSMQHRSKIVKYPPQTDSDQGVGPHTDSGFLTFLLQASQHRGLQAQNLDGQWIDVPPLENTLVVNLGKALETVTYKVAIATTHRVLSPHPGSGNRYSIPFFQIIRQDTNIMDIPLHFSPEIIALRDARGTTGERAWPLSLFRGIFPPPHSIVALSIFLAVNYKEYDRELSGHVSLIGRVKSHPTVAEKHYPELFKLYFPDGIAKGSAY